jgi:hypothetical protein
VAASFLNSTEFVRGIMGPIGSGKSAACTIEILRRSREQAPQHDGIRRTRWAVVRNSYPELKSTTLKTWAEWCPLAYGKVNMDSPITHFVRTPDMDMEVMFLALDTDEDVKKLLSLELTGAWFNEVREIPKGIIDAMTGRVGRYPAVKDGGCTWSGIIMDTNAPDDQSWYYRLAEKETPEGWKFFKQPSGTSPEAENIPNLIPGYYKRVSAGKDADWVKVYVDGEYGLVTEGKAVFPMYRDRIHGSPSIIPPMPGVPLRLGADFGLTPAAIIAQLMANGRWLVIDEFVTEDTGIIRFAESLAKYIATTYPEHQIGASHGDPSGMCRMGESERTALSIMTEYTGWQWLPAPTNDPVVREEAVGLTLNRLVDGEPGVLISQKCPILRKGLAGGYHRKPVSSTNNTQFHMNPVKNKWSHPCEGFEYLLLGGGEGDVVQGRSRRRRGQSRSFQAAGVDEPVLSS